MKPELFIAPSLLSANPLALAEDLEKAENGGADWHHVDVMDGHFVPNLTCGPPLVKALKAHSKLPLDVHIMVSNPDKVALDYVKAGADLLSFHVEAAAHHHRLLQSIKDAGAQAGVAINPGTPLEVLEPLLWEADLITVMSVNPGFGGQKFIPATLDRVEKLADMLARKKRLSQVTIEVDGGVELSNASQLVKAGARALVAGTSVYGATDPAQAVSALRNAATG